MAMSPLDPQQLAPDILARSYAELLERESAVERTDPAEDRNKVESPAAPPPVQRLIEAMLFVGGPPMTAERAAEAVRGLTPPLFLQAIELLNRDYRNQGRPYRIRPRDQGF